MKYIIIIAIILHSIFSLGQSDTTYYLATGEVSVFAFESEPTFSNVSTSWILLENEGTKIMLLPQGEFDGARLVTEIDSRYYEIMLDWTDDKSKVNYFKDFRENSLNDCVAPVEAIEATAEKRYVEGNKHIISKEVLERVQLKLAAFQNNKIIGTKLSDTRAINDGFQASLVVAFVDRDHFYLRFRLKNKQSIIYDLNPVRLSYESRQKKNLFKDDAVYKIEVKATALSTDIKHVKGNSIEFYYMAVPLFALDKKGKLKATFSERNGMRDVTVPVYSNRIANLKYVGDDFDLIDAATKNQ